MKRFSGLYCSTAKRTGTTVDFSSSRKGIPFVLLSVALLVALAATVAHAKSCNVPSEFPTIQAAVADATCDKVNIAPGTYHGGVIIGRDVTLNGEDEAATTIIDGRGVSEVVAVFAGSVTIKGVTIQNGNSPGAGGGILNNESTLIVTNSVIADNTASLGGGIFNNNGTLIVINSVIADNTADIGGGIFNNNGTLIVTNSVIADNTAGISGGGILNNNGTMTLTRTTLVNNTPDDCVGTGCP